DEPAHLLQLFFLDPLERIEIAHFSGKSAIERAGVKRRDRADPALARLQVAPDLVGPDARPADQPNTRHDNSAVQRKALLFGMGRPASYLVALACFSM